MSIGWGGHSRRSGVRLGPTWPNSGLSILACDLFRSEVDLVGGGDRAELGGLPSGGRSGRRRSTWRGLAFEAPGGASPLCIGRRPLVVAGRPTPSPSRQARGRWTPRGPALSWTRCRRGRAWGRRASVSLPADGAVLRPLAMALRAHPRAVMGRYWTTTPNLKSYDLAKHHSP